MMRFVVLTSLILACCLPAVPHLWVGSLCIAQPVRHASSLGGDTTCGIVWDTPILLSDTTVNSHSPQITLSGNDTVHIVWATGNGGSRLPYVRSTTGGQILEPRRDILIDSVSFPGRATWTQVVAFHQRVFMFFEGAATGDDPVWMMESSDYGANWLSPRSISAEPAGEIRSVGVIGDTLAIIYAPQGLKKILRSSDSGQTWSRTNEALAYHSRISVSRGFLHLVQNVEPTTSIETEYRRSTDLGNTWIQQEVISDMDGFESGLSAIGSNGDSSIITAWRDAKYGCLTLVGCGVAGRWSLNAGAFFESEKRYDDHPAGIDASPAVLGNKMVVAWTDDLNEQLKATISFDRGETWCTPITLSSNGGGQPRVVMSSAAVHIVWATGNGSIGNRIRTWYRRGTFLSTGVSEQPKEIPAESMLSQNYPNPFNPGTIINYQLARQEMNHGGSTTTSNWVTLKVFDLLGREVVTLVNEKKEAGEHTVEWNAENVPSGVYYYRLVIGNRMETRKAILIK